MKRNLFRACRKVKAGKGSAGVDRQTVHELSSYGFRPGRSAHDALKSGSAFVEEGRLIVVDLDLEKFFDRVNHDILMSRLARHVKDKRLLKRVRRFLQAVMMSHGVCVQNDEGTPQGGPLSPLLANRLLDLPAAP
jgi:RNA-directed DNA polymerase